jgi:hypothetical protein
VAGPKEAIVNKGYHVMGGIGGMDIFMPNNLKRESYYLKKREESYRSRIVKDGLT